MIFERRVYGHFSLEVGDFAAVMPDLGIEAHDVRVLVFTVEQPDGSSLRLCFPMDAAVRKNLRESLSEIVTPPQNGGIIVARGKPAG